MANWKGIVGQGFSTDAFQHYVDTIAFDTWRPQFVVLHNTAIPNLTDWHAVPGDARMRGLEHYYRDLQHWSAGPHLFVADDLIWVFTPLTVSGVHSPSWNSISYGLEMVGDYEVEPFSAAVRGNAVNALTTLHAALGMDPGSLRLHKEDPRTTHNCPGKNVDKADMIQAVSAALAALEPGDHSPGAALSAQPAGS
jgi:N-acetylmuramoyl-L-alanine amidase-like protein